MPFTSCTEWLTELGVIQKSTPAKKKITEIANKQIRLIQRSEICENFQKLRATYKLFVLYLST